MPFQELPEEFIRPIGSPSNSSLSSNTSDMILINAHYIRNSRSGSISSSATNDDSFEPNINAANIVDRSNRNMNPNDIEEDEEASYQPIKLPTEPTLEELLVRAGKF